MVWWRHGDNRSLHTVVQKAYSLSLGMRTAQKRKGNKCIYICCHKCCPHHTHAHAKTFYHQHTHTHTVMPRSVSIRLCTPMKSCTAGGRRRHHIFACGGDETGRERDRPTGDIYKNGEHVIYLKLLCS